MDDFMAVTLTVRRALADERVDGHELGHVALRVLVAWALTRSIVERVEARLRERPASGAHGAGAARGGRA